MEKTTKMSTEGQNKPVKKSVSEVTNHSGRKPILITKEMMIGEAVRINPKAAQIMFEHGLHCIGCCGAAMETIEDGARGHGLTDEEIEAMINEMNAQ